jgi:hypothetical protein
MLKLYSALGRVYRRAIRPTTPARRPATGLVLEAAPWKGTELVLGFC